MNIAKVIGSWTEGYTLDFHSLYSIPIGEDEFGRMRFDTKRTELGELIYKMKYNGHIDTSKEIVEVISPFLDRWLLEKNIDFIIPVPPTKIRRLQPVFAIVEQLANRYDLEYDLDVFKKTSDIPAKDMAKDKKELSGAIEMTKHSSRTHNILIVDDLYESGSTANECAKLLLEDINIANVYYLALTRTR